jgi:hypothetical protein
MLSYEDEITLTKRDLEDLIDKGINNYYNNQKYGNKQRDMKYEIMDVIELELAFRKVR